LAFILNIGCNILASTTVTGATMLIPFIAKPVVDKLLLEGVVSPSEQPLITINRLAIT
jgi:hypothetical protein